MGAGGALARLRPQNARRRYSGAIGGRRWRGAVFCLDFSGGVVYNSGISIPYFYPSGGHEAPGGFFSPPPPDIYTRTFSEKIVYF